MGVSQETVADARAFRNGRQVSAWLGLVPRQSSSGGKSTLLGMSKRGDVYLRTLLIHGARSVIFAARHRGHGHSGWLRQLLDWQREAADPSDSAALIASSRLGNV